MTFRVEPAALRRYAGQLADGRRVADAANSYVQRHGSFSFHEKGLLGFIAPGHRHLMADLGRLLSHLGELSDASSKSMSQVADGYEHSDKKSQAAIDATYPEVPRTSLYRD
jgi:hypothetical protein